MRFSSALIPFLSSLSTTSVTMAMEEPHDSVLHDTTASILEESPKVKYKNKKSYLEPLKIQNSNDGHPNKANAVELADDKGDIMQKKELIHHLVDHQEHQEEKSLEECNTSSTTTTTAAAAAATSDDDSLMKRKISSNKESITKMDYGHLNRGTCSSPNDACVPQNKAIEANFAFLEPEDASYASSGYCVPLSVLEGMEYKNAVATTMSLIDNEEFNKEEEMTDSYYHYHPQYDEHHRQLDSLDCASACPDPRLDVSTYVTDDDFRYLVYNCSYNEVCPLDYKDISCWNTAGITDMNYAFSGNTFNDPLKCWDVGLVTAMRGMFNSAVSFNQPIGSWNVSQVKDMSIMFNNARRFNQSIDSWDVSQVENMDEMFSSAISFNQPLDTWDVSQVEDMSGMFSRATPFNQPIDTWDVSQVYYMDSMFFATSFNQCLSTWAEKTSGYVDTNYMLYDTDCPNEYATIGPWCQDNTQGCFAPGFGTPTGAPTGTKNPNECNNVNESDFSFKGKSCSKYLKKKTGKKCRKIIDGVLVADSCPSLCKRFCPPCKDKSGKIKLENGKRFNCKKIKKKKKCNSITKSGALAKEICPVACKFEGC